MQTLKVERCLPSALHSGNRDGVVSMDSQVETVLGSQPQRGPPPATGVSDPEHVAGKGQSKCLLHSRASS